MSNKLLYHFTSRENILFIEETGEIRTTESNLSFRRSHAGPDVVWLSDDPDARKQPSLLGSVMDKTAVRLTVLVPAGVVKPWTEWVTEQETAEPDASAALIATGKSAASWWGERTLDPSVRVDVRRSALGGATEHRGRNASHSRHRNHGRHPPG